MASTIYRRPDLFPFALSIIPTSAALGATYATFGTTADALQCLTNLLTFSVSVSWSFSWKFPEGITPIGESYSANINLPLFIPSDSGATNSSTVSWYNKDVDGAKRDNPAARVLYSASGDAAIAQAFTNRDPEGDPITLQTHLRFTRTAGVIGLALYLDGAHGIDKFYCGFNATPADDIASTTVDLMGTSVPLYLKASYGASSIQLLSTVTFNATVTPTFAAA